MALMAAVGEIKPMPQVAIFADTGWEPKAVYEWLDWLEKQLPYPVVRVAKGNLREDNVTAKVRGVKSEGQRWASLPYFTTSPDKDRGQISRQCTSEYKIMPIETYLKREVLGLIPRKRLPTEPQLIQWRGISTDERRRAKLSREKWFDVRYPLIEAGMTRGHCLEWMANKGYPTPPRSACIGCPYHSDAEWLRIKTETPDEWADVVDFDKRIRVAGGMRGETFLHSSLKPLDEVDLLTPKSAGQQDMFGEECEGMCGL
jgi:hypothetical protein